MAVALTEGLGVTGGARRGLRDRTSAKLADDLYGSDDVGVEFRQTLCRHPPLRVLTAADLLYRELGHEIRADTEASNAPVSTGWYVPVSCDLDGVFLVCDRIEDRLVWEPGRPSAKVRSLQQSQFLRPGWSKEGDGVVLCHFAKLHYAASKGRDA